MNLTLSRKALMLVSIPLAFEVVFVVSLGILLHQVDYERAREAHARDVASHYNNLLRILLDRGSSLVFTYLTKSEVFRQRFQDGRGKSQKEEDLLQNLVRNDPSEREAVVRMSRMNAACNEHLQSALKMMRENDLIGARREWTHVQDEMEALVQASEDMVKVHESIESERSTAQAKYRQSVELLLYAGVAFNILLAIFLALYFNKGTSKRLQVVIDNTLRLASGQSLIPPLSGNDEIAYLDQTFRQMSQSLAVARQKERTIVENAAEMICTINSQGDSPASIQPARPSWDVGQKTSMVPAWEISSPSRTGKERWPKHNASAARNRKRRLRPDLCTPTAVSSMWIGQRNGRRANNC